MPTGILQALAVVAAFVAFGSAYRAILIWMMP